ncbi:MAG: amidohydrolase family protein [Thermoplasmata archaeon]|jgi:predicted TIM-barrel fold metal-dependent hydrolase|nr:amidohydrolase family protein [Thermoplasmata archaeon]
MGVTDCHVHINPIWEMRPDAAQLLGYPKSAPSQFLKDPAAFLEYLDTSGVERAALINYVAPEVIGYTEKANDFVSEYVRTNPERLIAVGGLRPDHPDPEHEVGRLAEQLHLRAIKLHPPHQGFSPNAYADGELPGLRALYAACVRYELPVIFHTGTSVFPRARNRFADPMLIEDVAVDFPELTIVLAHGGRPIWMETAVFLTRRFPNVWLELSGIPPARLLEYFPTLTRLSEKVLFGTDWPGPGVKDIGANLEAFRALPIPATDQHRILEENPLKVFPRLGPT